jgi:hypothetical protein
MKRLLIVALAGLALASHVKKTGGATPCYAESQNY